MSANRSMALGRFKFRHFITLKPICLTVKQSKKGPVAFLLWMEQRMYLRREARRDEWSAGVRAEVPNSRRENIKGQNHVPRLPDARGAFSFGVNLIN